MCDWMWLIVIPNSISKDTQDDCTCVLNSLNQHFIDISDIVSKSNFDKDSFKDLENKLNYNFKREQVSTWIYYTM